MPAEIPATDRRRRYGSRERLRRGRLWVFLFFCALRGSDALIYFGAPAIDRQRSEVAIIVGAAWTSVALAGLWYRKDWCRYLLSFLILATTVAFTFVIPGIYQLPANYRLLAFLFAAASIDAAVIWAVVALPDIRRLTSRSYM